MADRVILEVNAWQPAARPRGCTTSTTAPHYRHFESPSKILHVSDRIGVPFLHCPQRRLWPWSRQTPPIALGVQTGRRHLAANRRTPPRVPGQRGEGRAPARVAPALQSGVGNIANAVLRGLDGGPFHPLTAYTEVIQDGMLALLRSGTMSTVSATAFSLSEEGAADLHANIAQYHERIILRPQEISNHPR